VGADSSKSNPSVEEYDSQSGGEQNQRRFAAPVAARDEYTDERALWDWKSRYPADARCGINCEAWALGVWLLVVVSLAALFLSLSGQRLQIPLSSVQYAGKAGASVGLVLSFEFRILALFFAGWVGGTTFSIKWLVHAVATGRWHLDRRYWRLLVPGLGGVYACAVLTLFDAGIIGGGQPLSEPRPIAVAAAFAFMIGYFSDGVSGLLSNIAHAVFGTLEKK
jgi:hypothetical protein